MRSAHAATIEVRITPKGTRTMADYAELLTAHGIDYADAMDRFGDNEALYLRLAIKFLVDQHLPSLESALREDNLDEAYRQAHSLKGVAGNLSFANLYREASIVSAALHDGDGAIARAHMPAIRSAYDQVMTALRQIA